MQLLFPVIPIVLCSAHSITPTISFNKDTLVRQAKSSGICHPPLTIYYDWFKKFSSAVVFLENCLKSQDGRLPAHYRDYYAAWNAWCAIEGNVLTPASENVSFSIWPHCPHPAVVNLRKTSLPSTAAVSRAFAMSSSRLFPRVTNSSLLSADAMPGAVTENRHAAHAILMKSAVRSERSEIIGDPLRPETACLCHTC